MRLFLAINIPQSVRDAIYCDAAPLRTATTGVRWVASTGLHVTLKFLGERDEGIVPEVKSALESVAKRHVPVSVETTGVGAFPNFRRPRVVWLGMTGERALQALARDIDQALSALGIPREARPFQPHLTLGRVKSELSAAEAAALEKAAGSRHGARSFAVQTVDLMRSELGPGGSRYTVMAAVPLHTRGN
jgi:2'-5' RNA ligase